MGGYGEGKGMGIGKGGRMSQRYMDELAELEAKKTPLGPELKDETEFSLEDGQKMLGAFNIMAAVLNNPARTVEDLGVYRDAKTEYEELARKEDIVKLRKLQRDLVDIENRKPPGWNPDADFNYRRIVRDAEAIRRRLQRNRPEL